jgi:hypothetical protein
MPGGRTWSNKNLRKKQELAASEIAGDVQYLTGNLTHYVTGRDRPK